MKERILENLSRRLCQSSGMTQSHSQLTFLSLFTSFRYRRVSALYAYQLSCSRPDLQEVSDWKSIKDEDCPRGPLAGRKALHASLNRGIDEIFLDDARWIRIRGNEGEHSMHSLQDLGQLIRVLVVYLDPCYTLDG